MTLRLQQPHHVSGTPARFQNKSTETAGPSFYRNKSTSAADELKTPRDHLITWLSDWVREYGVDALGSDR